MRKLLLVTWLAYKDLYHDIRMTVCLILTIAAIALPLLLFFGLKNGVIETMQQRMIHEPRYMEIILQETHKFDSIWFDTWRKNPHVAFLVPRTRKLSVSGTFSNADATTKSEKGDLAPTDVGDWLLQSYNIAIPQEGECTLTASLAQELKAQKGSRVTFRITRQEQGSSEPAILTLIVNDVLPHQASGEKRAFIPLRQLEDVEAFKDGHAVPKYGWKGNKGLAHPVFYSALLYTREPLDPTLFVQLQQRTGFIYKEDAPNAAIQGWYVTRLSTRTTPIESFKLQELYNIFRGKEIAVVPLAGQPSKHSIFSVSILPIHDKQDSAPLSLELMSTPLWAADTWQGTSLNTVLDVHTPQAQSLLDPQLWNTTQHIPAVILLSPTNAALFSEGKIYAHIQAYQDTKPEESVRIPLTVLANTAVADTAAYIAPGLMGRINLLVERPLTVADAIPEEGIHIEVELFLGRKKEYPTFRMYACSLDDVAPLAAQLESTGLTISTMVAEIERVRRMDEYISLILIFIATASISGGIICLLASLYANVERKRRSFAVLRLLGIHGITLCIFPLASGLLMTGLGILLSLLLFQSISFCINVFAQEFTLPGEVLCSLNIDQQCFVLCLSLLAAIVAGFFASIRLIRIEAAEGLRDE